MAHAQTRQHAHELIERMAPGQVPAAVELLEKMLDPEEFLSDYGIRSLSRFHADNPYSVRVDNQEFRVAYVAEERAVARAKAETGPSTSMEDLLTEYRLTAQELERRGQTPCDARGKNT